MTAVDEQHQRDPNAEDQIRRRQRAKNWALFAALVGFVVIVYFVSIVKMSGG